MADLTIRVPSDHVDAFRDGALHLYATVAESLHRAAGDHAQTREHADALHGSRRELSDLEGVLDDLGWTYEPAAGAIELTAHPEVLSDIAYGAVGDALDALAATLEDYWRARADRSAARAALRTTDERFALFDAVQQGGR